MEKLRIIIAAIIVCLNLEGCALEIIGVTSEDKNLYISSDENGRSIVVDSKGERQTDYLVDKDGNIATWDNRTITVAARYASYFWKPDTVEIFMPEETTDIEIKEQTLQDVKEEPAEIADNQEEMLHQTETVNNCDCEIFFQEEYSPGQSEYLQIMPSYPAETTDNSINPVSDFSEMVPVIITTPVPVSTPVPIYMPAPASTPAPDQNVYISSPAITSEPWENEVPAAEPASTPAPNNSEVPISQTCEHDHIWMEIARREASCTENGMIVFECGICEQTRYETINAGHDFDSVGVCRVCGWNDGDIYRNFGRTLGQSGKGEYQIMVGIVKFVYENAYRSSCTGYSNKCLKAAETAGISCTARSVWDVLCPITGEKHTWESFGEDGFCECGMGNNHTWVRFNLSEGYFEYDLQGQGTYCKGKNMDLY